MSAAKATSIISVNPILTKAALNWSIVTSLPNWPIIAGATAAITVLLFFNKSKIGKNSILSKIRPLLHESTQIPQSIQISLSIKVVLFE